MLLELVLAIAMPFLNHIKKLNLFFSLPIISQNADAAAPNLKRYSLTYKTSGN
jgi:hypothetical protein